MNVPSIVARSPGLIGPLLLALLLGLSLIVAGRYHVRVGFSDYSVELQPPLPK